MDVESHRRKEDDTSSGAGERMLDTVAVDPADADVTRGVVMPCWSWRGCERLDGCGCGLGLRSGEVERVRGGGEPGEDVEVF
jgi:hypothetical protein